MDGKNNIAFTGFLILGEIDKCLDLLCRTHRISEAALLARTYAPSQVPRLVNQWKKLLIEQKKHKVAEMISEPFSNPEMFPDHKYAVFAEEVFKKRRSNPTSASEYAEWKDSLEWDILNRIFYIVNHRAEKELSRWTSFYYQICWTTTLCSFQFSRS